MPKVRHIGPVIFAAFFILAAVAMTLFGTLPTHLAITAKAMMLLYAISLFALAFAPVKGERKVEGQAAPAKARFMGAAGAKG